MSEVDTSAPQIAFTDSAFAKLSEVIDNHPNPVAGLRLEIADRRDGQFRHLLSMVEEGAELPNDTRVETPDGIAVFVHKSLVSRLKNNCIDFIDGSLAVVPVIAAS